MFSKTADGGKRRNHHEKNAEIQMAETDSAEENIFHSGVDHRIFFVHDLLELMFSGQHVGIVSGKGKTISASIITGKVVENDWGFRGKDKTPTPNMRFFRYTGDDK